MPAACTGNVAGLETDRQDYDENDLRPRRQVYIRQRIGNPESGPVLTMMVDNGAEMTIIRPDALAKLEGFRARSLCSGDVSQLKMACGKSTIPVLGIADIWVNFGPHRLLHQFLVAEIAAPAIIGSDFFDSFGSTMRYDDMTFQAKADTPSSAVSMKEWQAWNRDDRCAPSRSAADLSAVRYVASALAEGPEEHTLPHGYDVTRQAVAAERLVVPPMSQIPVELSLSPAYRGDGNYFACLEPIVSRQRPSVGLASAVVTVRPNGTVFSRVLNATSEPIVLERGAKLGTLSYLSPDAIVTPVHDQQSACAAAASVVGGGNAEAPPVAAAGVPSEPTEDCPALVSDEAIMGMLHHDGKLAAALEGCDSNGTPWRDRALALLRAKRAAFAVDAKNPTPTDLMEIDIPTGDAAPIAEKARRYSQAEQTFIMEQVERLLANKQIEGSHSPWACNPVLVRQKDKMRFCIDYRKLNSVTRKDSHGLGNIDDMLQQLNGSTVLSSLDLASGYYQIPLSREAAPKTAFRVPSGALFQFTVAPFGLVNLPAAFTRLMHRVLGDALGVFACVYIDDILVFSRGMEEHLAHLEVVLDRIIAGKLSCSVPKSQLFRSELKFVGHVVGRDGLWPDPEKVAAMVEMAEPLKDGKPDVPLVQAVCGLFNYYRRYVPNYSTVVAPITDLVKTRTPKVWTPQCQDAFDALKRILASDTVLAHPDFSLPFVLQTDASKTALGGVLSQFRPLTADAVARGSTGRTVKTAEGLMQEVVVGYWSRRNSELDEKKSATELECLAVLAALLHFRPYVFGHHVTVITDAKALNWLMTKDQLKSGHMMRYALRLQEFYLTIQHRPGKTNNADALSRNPRTSELERPQAVDEMDLDWPDALLEKAAPPCGIDFAPDDAPAMEFSVSALGSGAIVRSDCGPAFELNAIIASGTAANRCAMMGSLYNLAEGDERLEELFGGEPYYPDSSAELPLRVREPCAPEQFPATPAGLATAAPSGRYVDIGFEAQLGELRRLEAAVQGMGSPKRSGPGRVPPPSTVPRAVSVCASVGRFEELEVLPDADHSVAPGPTGHLAATTRGDARRAQAPVNPSSSVNARPSQDASPRAAPARAPLTSPAAANGRQTVAPPQAPAVLRRPTFLQAQLSDPYCTAIRAFLDDKHADCDDELALELLAMGQDYLEEEDGMIVRLAPSFPKEGTMLRQWVVPASLRALVLKLGHDDPLASHPGIAATAARLGERFWWRTFTKDVRAYVLGCLECQSQKQSNTTLQPQQAVSPPRLWGRLTMDILDMHVVSDRGNRYVHAIVEAQTGFVFLFPQASKDQAAALECFHAVALEVGMPDEIGHDRGGEYLNFSFADYCKSAGVRQCPTSSYHPQANGRVERWNKRIQQALTQLVSRTQTDWDLHLKTVQFACRTVPRDDMGVSPFFMVYGREPHLPCDVAMSGPGDRELSRHHNVERLLDSFDMCQRLVEAAFERRREATDKRNSLIKRSLKVSAGDWVWLRMEPLEGSAHKISPRWSGPWLVLREAHDSGVTFVCRQMGRQQRVTVAHASRMKRFYDRPAELRGRYGTGTGPGMAAPVANLPIDAIKDRRMETDGEWSYFTPTPSAPTEFQWRPESQLLQWMPPTRLDTFHALYELRHADHMPRHARRRDVVPAARALTKEQALAKHPLGTPLVRHGPLHMVNGQVAYEWGMIQGYRYPYWRGRFGDLDWANMTRTQVREAVQLHRMVTARGYAPTAAGAKGASAPLQQRPVARCPADLGPQCKGLRIAKKFSTGWDLGTVGKHMPRLPHLTMEVRFDGELGPRDTRLERSTYDARPDAPVGAWYFVEDAAVAVMRAIPVARPAAPPGPGGRV